jgi:hypothetical protein
MGLDKPYVTVNILSPFLLLATIHIEAHNGVLALVAVRSSWNND